VKGAVILSILGIGVAGDSTLDFTSAHEALATPAALDAGLATHTVFLLECVAAADSTAGVGRGNRARAVESSFIFDSSIAAVSSSVAAIKCGAWASLVSEIGCSRSRSGQL